MKEIGKLSIRKIGTLLWHMSVAMSAPYTEKTMLPFPFILNGIWSWWQFSFRFLTKWKSIWFRKSKGKLSPLSYPIQFVRKWSTSFLGSGTFRRRRLGATDSAPLFRRWTFRHRTFRRRDYSVPELFFLDSLFCSYVVSVCSSLRSR